MDVEHAPPEFYEALGRTIQVMRTDQGLDRKDLADRAGISYSYLAAIENGKKPPSSKVLFAIAGALGLLNHELLASVETRLRRQQPPAPAARFATPSARRAWLHAGAASLPAASAARPRWAADQAYPAAASGAPIPYTEAGFLMELERLNPQLSDEDRDIVLTMARRLAAAE